MADWFIDTSATNNGDGTSASAAGSTGGVGAANDFRTMMLNTHPYATTIAGGDDIYIRTNDGTDDCEATITTDLTVGLPSTLDAPIRIFFDNGVKWSGDSGVFTLKLSSNSVQYNGKEGLEYYADGTNYRFCIESLYTGTYHDFGDAIECAYSDGMHWKCETSNCFSRPESTTAFAPNVTIENFKFTGRLHTNTAYPLFHSYRYASTRFINPIFDLTADVAHSTNSIIFKGDDADHRFEVIGGKIIAAWSDLRVIYANRSPSSMRFRNFDVGGALDPISYGSTSERNDSLDISMIGCTGVYDALYRKGDNLIEYREDNLAPYLDATLVDGTSWSYKVRGLNLHKASPASLVPIEKAYTQSAAIKTLTVEFLIDNTFTVTASDLFAVFSYFDDTTGDVTNISTRVLDGALSVSTASWSNDTYGSKQFNKRKLTVTTPTSIKENSMIYVALYSNITQVSAADLYFYNPDVSIS